MPADPFGALGLAARPDLIDDDVRAAWRRIAAATHPDRDDGGDPARFASAAAAYAELRTPFGRGEALADMQGSSGGGVFGGGSSGGGSSGSAAFGRNFRHFGERARSWRTPVGGPVAFGLRVLVAAAVTAGAVLAAGWSPGALAILAGALTWLSVWLFRTHGNASKR